MYKPWNLTDLKAVPKLNRKVFSCFHCAGGSTMGYKLAGFDVIGGVEIDPEIMSIYRLNHDPKYSYLMGVQDFNKKYKNGIPKDLSDIDMLDGSPPCSSFSMAGSREKKWGKKKYFREGQAEQVLDDLFFHYIETARLLQPKIVIAENVAGLIMGKAKGYVKMIVEHFKLAGYSTVQLFLLDASEFGVPQKRMRTIFIANRINKKFTIKGREQIPTVGDCFEGLSKQVGRPLTEKETMLYRQIQQGQAMSKAHEKGHMFNQFRLSKNKPAPTVTASGMFYHFEEERKLSPAEWLRLQSFPDDFKTNKPTIVKYVCGMSVPPYMMKGISRQIAEQMEWVTE